MPSDPKPYDLIVIGGGPAGLIATTVARVAKKTVALIDAHKELGGAGINTGTVPSKTLRETAVALSGMQSRNLYGVDLSLRREVTIGDFLHHEQNVRSIFNETFRKRVAIEHADSYTGFATFVDPHTIKIESNDGGEPVLLRGEHILIATGSSPVQPSIFPFNKPGVYDSDTILKLSKIPKEMACIGAGVIGSEYASTFAALGAKVHLVDGRDKLLGFLDVEVSRELEKAMTRSGINFLWNEKVERCETDAGEGPVTLHFASGNSLTVDSILVAAGRQSNTGKLNLAAAGVTVGERGLITVDDQFRTNVPHILAAGDVIGFPALASTSMEQARRAIALTFGLKIASLSPIMPNGIYTIPEVSMIGETEESLKKKGIDYVAGRARYAGNARGQIIGDKDGFLKLLYRRSDMKLLGVHVMGELATEIVHIGLMAMLADQGADIFIEACFNVPTLGGLYKTATLQAVQEINNAKPN